MNDGRAIRGIAIPDVPPGVHARLVTPLPRSSGLRPALFLDRDGVINEEVGYLHRVDELVIRAGIADRIAAARKEGWETVIVTNQSGIGRGYFTWAEFEALQTEIEFRLRQENPGAAIGMICACPFHAQALPPYDVPDHPWRKPNPGMLLFAADTLGLDLKRSRMIGNSRSDGEAARQAGVVFEHV